MPEPNSYMKILQNLKVVAKEPFTVKDRVYKPPDILKISPSFFRTFGCPLHCGSCCFYFTLDYTPEGVVDVAKQYPQVMNHLDYRYTVPINGQEIEIATIQPPKKLLWDVAYCGYLKTSKDLDAGSTRQIPIPVMLN